MYAKPDKSFRVRVAATLALGAGAIVFADGAGAQIAPGGNRPAATPARFGRSFPTPSPRLPAVFFTPGPSGGGRAALPNRANPLPGGGPSFNTAALFRPPVSPPTPTPLARNFSGAGMSGVPAFGRRVPGAVGAGTQGFVEGSAFSANLAVNNGDFRFAAHLGSGLTHSAALDGVNFCGWPGWSGCFPIGPIFPGFSYAWPWYYYGGVYGESWPVVNYADYQYADPALSPNYNPQQQQTQAQTPPPPPPTAMELATAFMQERRYGYAAEQFREHLKKDPLDSLALRWMGVAQILGGKTKDGCETVARAYKNDPALGDAPLNLDEMGVTQLRVREACGPVVAYAKRSSSSGAYVAAAMLMQVRGRADLAIKMLTDAKTAGLDAEQYAKLSQSMTK